MSKTKELIICIISIIALVLAITTTVFATDDLMATLGNNTNNTDNDFQQVLDKTNNANNTNTIDNTNKTNNTNNTNGTNTTIPYTGIDYSVVVIIAICGVSAVYAYKKIRDYNV